MASSTRQAASAHDSLDAASEIGRVTNPPKLVVPSPPATLAHHSHPYKYPPGILLEPSPLLLRFPPIPRAAIPDGDGRRGRCPRNDGSRSGLFDHNWGCFWGRGSEIEPWLGSWSKPWSSFGTREGFRKINGEEGTARGIVERCGGFGVRIFGWGRLLWCIHRGNCSCFSGDFSPFFFGFIDYLCEFFCAMFYKSWSLSFLFYSYQLAFFRLLNWNLARNFLSHVEARVFLSMLWSLKLCYDTVVIILEVVDFGCLMLHLQNDRHFLLSGFNV